MNISPSFKKLAAGACIAIAGCVNAFAVEVNDLGVLVPGVEYSWKQYTTVKGEYTPSQTGPVKFVFKNSPIAIYTDADHNENSIVRGDFSYADGNQVASFSELKEGTTYYLYSAYAMDDNTLVIYEGTSELKLVSTIPSTDPEADNYYGGALSASAYYEAVVNFNFPVTVGNVFLVAPDNTRVAVSAKAGSPSVGCDIAPALMELYHDGKIKEGDEVTLRLLQVTDASDKNNKYNRNGRCEINFKVAAKPLELVEIVGANRTSVENVFNSYYLPGDENAKIKFIFDAPLATDSKAVASIAYGDPTNLEVGAYYEDVEATHDGDTAIFDFSGRRRRPIDMLPESDSTTQPESIYVSFGNIKSPDGQRAYTGSKSNPTGYPVSFLLNILQYTVVGDFTPARGSELVFGQPMEIWVMNGNKIAYDAIQFEYTENGQQKFYDMPEEAVKVEADPASEDAMLFTFDIPTLSCDEGTPVYVRMTGLQCADGLDHSNDVYGDFTQATNGIIDATFTPDAKFDVFDIAGVRVLSNASANDLSGLAKGIYVVNGKKIVIR